MSCQHTFTFGAHCFTRCQRLPTETGYCKIHSIQVAYWDTSIIRDFTSFLEEMMYPQDITPDLVQHLVTQCIPLLQTCARSRWTTEEKEELHTAVSQLLKARFIAHN